jgi:hypothetical protein
VHYAHVVLIQKALSNRATYSLFNKEILADQEDDTNEEAAN